MVPDSQNLLISLEIGAFLMILRYLEQTKMVFLQFSRAIFHRKNNIFIDAYTLPLEQAYNFSLSPTILISRLKSI